MPFLTPHFIVPPRIHHFAPAPFFTSPVIPTPQGTARISTSIRRDNVLPVAIQEFA
jgi:hypothetical protein